jgi:hypothetical protein
MAEAYLTGCPARPTLLPSSAAQLRAAAPSALFVSTMSARLGSADFFWAPASLAVDDGINVIKPNDVPLLNPGRWLFIPSAAPGGFVDFELSGVYAAAIVPGTFDPMWSPKTNATITLIELTRRTAGTAGTTLLDITINGVTLFLLPADQPLATAGFGDNVVQYFSIFDPAMVTLVPTDLVECVLQTVETFKLGPPPGPEGLRVRLYYTEP